ncbi:GTP cyclohydrolase I FolE [Thioalkalivibrio denitrificans]|uniref:GTP cyclohydrolase 1 n=1 Tax=Thioalkalivibrio denitrificans TaxID=108003 RepID=A0A1V3NHK9_9GAMM|nr:GTP cyclohydrolase I FolE [Thioalkalivibrio denitrificans]OOG24551.1 GTP cyclohydrolase I FolE [Thioalkalivibrio denitrificans]
MTEHQCHSDDDDFPRAESEQRMAEQFTRIIAGLGEDPERHGLAGTPLRAARAMAYLTRGYEQSLEELVNGALFDTDNDEMVLVRDIEFYSLCEHHLLPFLGKCHVAYLPKGRVVGLSKIARIVDMFSRRLQIQETLTRQIADAIESVTDARGVAVVMEAKHLCMMMRGVEKQNATMTTSMMLGTFREDARTRAEFMGLIRGG